MIVKSLKLYNFRAHQRYEADLARPVTVITGPNGSGKTSILEAVYCLLLGASFRSADQEIIRYGGAYWQVDLTLADGSVRKMRRSAQQKEVKIGDKKTRSLPRVARYPVVLFTPSDLNLIHRSPGNRRDYFDQLLGRLDTSYRLALGKYKRAVTQRNKLLKSPLRQPGDTRVWDELLARYGSEILLKRHFYTGLLNERLPGTYQKIAMGEPALQYTGRALSETEYQTALNHNLARDNLLKTTSFGPHRDDYQFYFNDHLATDVASQGENRTIIVALKFIESDLYLEQSNQAPLVLLDDIFSELDEARQTALLQNFQDHQVIITAVQPPRGLKSHIKL